MVGPCGLEPQTSTVSRWRSNQLSYGPELSALILAQGCLLGGRCPISGRSEEFQADSARSSQLTLQ